MFSYVLFLGHYARQWRPRALQVMNADSAVKASRAGNSSRQEVYTSSFEKVQA